MTENSSGVVITEQRGQTLIVTINRPEVKNAINYLVAEGIGKAMELLDADAGLRVGIITGAQGVFCSGMDLGSFARNDPKPRYQDRGFAGLVRRPPRKPLIAAVEGFAVAGGFEIAIASDLIIAGETAQFGLPEVRRALVAAAGALIRLPRRLPYGVVMEMALTGEFVAARRLYELGLVNRITPPGKALAEAIALAERIVEGGPIAVSVTKQILVEQQDWTLDDMWEKQDAYYIPAVATGDAIEGARAFKEKRKPVWKGE